MADTYLDQLHARLGEATMSLSAASDENHRLLGQLERYRKMAEVFRTPGIAIEFDATGCPLPEGHETPLRAMWCTVSRIRDILNDALTKGTLHSCGAAMDEAVRRCDVILKEVQP